MPSAKQMNTKLGAVAAPTNSLPLVSVIVPTYNYGQFIGQTLESIRGQTYQKWECVVVDDDSTDDTPQVVANYAKDDSRIKYFHQKNQLQAAARNKGLQQTVGQYVQFLDADDLIEPLKLERQVAYLEQHPEVDIIYGSVRYFSSNNIHERRFSMEKENSPWMPEVSGVGKEILLPLVRSNIMVINSPLIRRNAVDEVGLFDRRLPPVEDWDFLLRCALMEKRFQYDAAAGTLALVRSHSASMSRNKAQMLRAMIRMRKKLARRVDDTDIRQLNRELIAADAWCLGVDEVVDGNLLQGMVSLVQAGLKARTLNSRMKMLGCALVAPFVSSQRFQVIAGSSVIGSLTGIWRRPRAE